MATHGDHEQTPLSPEWSYENSERGGWEVDLAEPSTPNRNRARTVGRKRVPDPKVKPPEHLLFCPVRAGRPVLYAKVTKKCLKGATYKGLSKLGEHIKRVHSEESLCARCMKVLPEGVTREMHLPKCRSSELTAEERAAYPSFLPKDVLSKVRDWRSTVTAHKDRSDMVANRWRHLFEIIYPGETIPEPMPSLPHVPTPGGKRKASSSLDHEPPGSRRRRTGPEPRVAGEGAEAVGFDLTPANLSQPQPSGHSAVPFGDPPQALDIHEDYVSPYNYDSVDPSLLPDAAAGPPIIATMDMKSIAPSETTAVTGLLPATFSGSTAFSDTNGFNDYADQLLTPSFATKDGDHTHELFSGWWEKEVFSMDSAPYPDTLDNEVDLLSGTDTAHTPPPTGVPFQPF